MTAIAHGIISDAFEEGEMQKAVASTSASNSTAIKNSVEMEAKVQSLNRQFGYSWHWLLMKWTACCICFLKDLTLAESSLAMEEVLVKESVSTAELAANTVKGAKETAEELESDSKAVSIEELNGKLSAT